MKSLKTRLGLILVAFILTFAFADAAMARVYLGVTAGVPAYYPAYPAYYPYPAPYAYAPPAPPVAYGYAAPAPYPAPAYYQPAYVYPAPVVSSIGVGFHIH